MLRTVEIRSCFIWKEVLFFVRTQSFQSNTIDLYELIFVCTGKQLQIRDNLVFRIFHLILEKEFFRFSGSHFNVPL